MKTQINIAELLKDCPKGTKLYSPIFGEVYLDKIRYHLAIIVTTDKYKEEFIYDGRYGMNGECMLFPSKDQRDWSKFQRPFKDGDVLVHTQNGRFIMSIYKSNENEKLINTHAIFWDREEGLNVGMQICCYTDNVRFATKEERQKLFDAIKENGYKWNPETKTLEKLVEPKFKIGDRVRNKNYKDYIYDIHDITDKGYRAKEINADSPIIILFGSQEDNYELVPNKFDVNNLKPFKSEVLVRDNKLQKWSPAIWGYYDLDSQDYPYKLVGGCAHYCIPYKKNEYLLGTTNDCDEFYKTW